MTYNDYKNDLMDNYGAIDRMWKIDSNRLIRVNGEGVEQYFYDLFHSEKDNFLGVLEEVRKFNLVNNKNIVKLNLYQRYKLLKLISITKSDLTRLSNMKKQLNDYENRFKKGVSKVVKSNPIVNVIGSVKDMVVKNDSHETPIINKETSNPQYKFDYEELKRGYQLRLKLELEKQRTANDLDRQYIQEQKSIFQKRIEELARKRMNDSVSLDELRKIRELRG